MDPDPSNIQVNYPALLDVRAILSTFMQQITPVSIDGLALIGVGLCLIVLAFTSAVDASISVISRHQINALRNDHAPRAAIIDRLLNNPYQFKATVLCLNAAAIIAATAFMFRLTFGLPTLWRFASLIPLLILVLIFTEAVPKTLATRFPSHTADMLARPMAWLTRLLWPLISFVDIVTRPLIRLLVGPSAPRTPLVTEEELLLLVNVGEEEGFIEPDEREMIEGIFSFGDTIVREVMCPRVDIVAVDIDASLDEALELIISDGHSRLPVFRETIDNVVGILHVKDLLPALRTEHHEKKIASLMRPPHFVPETMKVAALLKDLQTRKTHMTVVVDEYGGTAGVVTIEDLLEEIVGDIQDEYDADEPSIEVVKEGELLADARISLDDINDVAELNLESTESDRLGGLVYELLGRVPTVGDEVQVSSDIKITVVSVEGLGPRQLRITYPLTSQTVAVSVSEEEHTHDGHT
ncbi:MAG: hemolysin family protein [Chloroflexota bacterium]